MPAKSAKQERFMQAVANNPKFAKQVGVPQSVGREFTKGDEMKHSKKMAAGGMMKYARGGGIEHKGKTEGKMVKMAEGGGIREGRARFGDDVRERARQEMARRAAGVEAMPVKPPADTKARPINQAAPKPKPKPAPKPKAEAPKAEAPKAETAAKKEEPKQKRPSSVKDLEPGYLWQPRGRKAGGTVKKMAKGGSVSKRADGCAMKGKTKGRMV